MGEAIRQRAADLRLTLDRVEALLQGQGPTPPLLLARVLIDLDAMAATMNRHVDALQGASRRKGQE